MGHRSTVCGRAACSLLGEHDNLTGSGVVYADGLIRTRLTRTWVTAGDGVSINQNYHPCREWLLVSSRELLKPITNQAIDSL
jgi:hypothetical protein